MVNQKCTVFMFFVLIAGLTNAFEFQNLAEVQELAKNSYANELIQTISLKLQENHNIDEIQQLIEEILKELGEEKAKLDSEYESNKSELNTKIEDLKLKIKENEDKIKELQAIIDEYKPKHDQAVKNIEQYEHQIGENNAQLEENEQNRQKDEQAFKTSDEDHERLCGENGACDQVIAVLEKLRGSVQDQNALNANAQTTNQLNSEIAANAAVINGIQLGSLLQLATKIDQDKLEKIIEMIKGLKQSCLASWQDDKDKEEESKRTYEEIKKKLNDDNAKLQENIRIQTANRDEYKEKYETAEIDKEKLEEENRILSEDIVNLEKQLEQLKEVYERQTAVLKENNDCVEKIKRVFMSKIANMSGFLRERTASN